MFLPFYQLGYGKSLCYGCLHALRGCMMNYLMKYVPSIVIVVTPLIKVKDHVCSKICLYMVNCIVFAQALLAKVTRPLYKDLATSDYFAIIQQLCHVNALVYKCLQIHNSVGPCEVFRYLEGKDRLIYII